MRLVDRTAPSGVGREPGTESPSDRSKNCNGAEESRRHDDARWALASPEVLALFCGEFVVPYQREVVAHGTDAALVLTEAARITGRPVEELSLVGVIDPILDVPSRRAPGSAFIRGAADGCPTSSWTCGVSTI